MDRLANKIEAVNQVNRFANMIDGELRAAMEPWVGKQIIKADGDLSKRFKDSIADLTRNSPTIQIVRSHWSQACADFDVKINYPVGDHTVDYFTVSVRVATVKNGILEGFLPVYVRRTDYSFAVIRETHAEIKAARAVLHKAELAICPFRETD